MTILNKFSDENLKFTKSEKSLIGYIKNNLEKFSYKSISEIAKESDIGESTITRFSKKIGFNGFQDFKVALATEIANKHTTSIIDKSVDRFESAKDTATKLLNNNIHVLESTAQIINYENIHKSSELMLKAKKIYFFGVGYSGIIAQDISYKFMRIGLNCNCFYDSHTIFMMSSLLSSDDLAICISHSGETEDMIRAINIAQNNNVKIISITKGGLSTIKTLSDVNLEYLSNETIFETGSMYSKLAQIFLLDLIYTQVVKDMGNAAFENKIKTTNAITDNRKNK